MKETSTNITEEQRFKVLQIEEYEEQEMHYKYNIKLDFILSCMAGLMVVSSALNKNVISSSLFSLETIVFVKMVSEGIAKKANICGSYSIEWIQSSKNKRANNNSGLARP